MTQSMLWSQEHLARISQSPVSELEWMASVVNSQSSMLTLLTASGPDGWSGRTSPACSALTAAKPSLPSSDSSLVSPSKSLPVDGRTAESSQAHLVPMDLHSGCLTLSTAEYHSGAVASSLSDILETGDVPQRYFLSGKACRGILRRAEKRGKDLPMTLRLALQAVAGAPSAPAKAEGKTPSSRLKSRAHSRRTMAAEVDQHP